MTCLCTPVEYTAFAQVRNTVNSLNLRTSCRNEYPHFHSHKQTTGTCSRYNSLKSLESPRCTEVVNQTRFRCGHKVVLPCYQSARAEAFSPGARMSVETGVVEYDGGYCDTELDIPECLQTVCYRNECGHIVEDVKCSDAFNWADGDASPPQCLFLLDRINPVCRHHFQVTCSAFASMQGWNPGPPPGCVWFNSLI